MPLSFDHSSTKFNKMKRLIFLMSLALMADLAEGQTSTSKTAAEHKLQTGKDLQTVGWTMMGAGTVAFLVGLAVEPDNFFLTTEQDKAD